ncbi:MAG: M14 family zinc carboxypeptidase [Weeksellaceae bacterium]
MELLELFEKKYDAIRVPDFESRYLPFSKLKSYLDKNFSDKSTLGKSFLGDEIYGLKIGNGPIKILVWSQMHGNESTGTRAMLDVLEFLKFNEKWSDSILKSISLHYIPMLNPDGANAYNRRNGYGVDLNRDFIQESSPEIKILKNYVDVFQPNYLFNLHDQRSIFNVGNTPKTATLAFLAPSADENRTLTADRIRSMAVIDSMNKNLQKVMPGHIARFSDEFYPTSTGDNFMKLGYPSILFEAGHYPNDYSRNTVRKFNALAILLALDRIAKKEEASVGDYFSIPENNKQFLDIILRNVTIQSHGVKALTDIGIYYVETLNTESSEVEWMARVEEVGDLSTYYGHLELDMKGTVYNGKCSVYPLLNEFADFSVGQIHFEEGKYKG